VEKLRKGSFIVLMGRNLSPSGREGRLRIGKRLGKAFRLQRKEGGGE